MSITYLVQADLSGTAYGDSPTWTDITDQVLTGGGGSPINISGGRQNWLGDPNPGTCSLILDNQDGDFTPGNTSGAYYPHVKAGVRIRVTVTVASTDVHLFDGYVGAWRVQFTDGTYSTCSVTAQDILGGRWSNDLLRSFLAEEMLLNSPSALYMLQETEGSKTFADVTGQAGVFSIVGSDGNVDAGQQPTASDYFGGSMVFFDNPTPGHLGTRLYTTQGPTFTGPDFSLEIWVQTPETDSDGGFILSGGVAVGLDSGKLVFIFSPFSVETTFSVCDGLVHQVVVTWDNTTTTGLLYLDGVEVGTIATGAGVPASTIYLGQALSGALAYFGMWDGVVLSPTQILNHYNAGANTFAGELTSDRLARLLSYRPNLGTVLDTGLSRMGLEDIAGTSLQSGIVGCVNAEQSNAYIDGQGQVVFKSLDHLYNPTVALTLDASQDQVNGPTSFVDDMQYVLNDVTVTVPTGAAQRVFDQSSIDAIGTIPQQFDLNLDSDASGLSMAGWILANGVQEQTSAPQIDVDLATEPDDTLALAVLQTAPLDVIELTNLPAAAPASSLSYVMQGWSYQIGTSLFGVSFYTTPLPISVAVWDTDLWDGAPAWAF